MISKTVHSKKLVIFSMNTLITKEMIAFVIKPRKKISHKGDYGYGALVAGSRGMMGAAVLSARAFIRSGGGKLTCHVPEPGNVIMQVAVPEAMCKTEPGDDHIISISSLDKYDVIGIGPGLGPYASHKILLEDIFTEFSKPMVIDADALNAIARNQQLLQQVPVHSILTPHAVEFKRLFGETDSINELALEKAAKHNLIIVVKGPDTFIATPSGKSFTNTTGNPGMATGGSGDVLTGIITGLLAQHLSPEDAAVAGVYLHGLAGDIAADHKSQQALIASDIIYYLGDAYLSVQ